MIPLSFEVTIDPRSMIPRGVRRSLDGAGARGKRASWASCGPYAARKRPPGPGYAAYDNGGTGASSSQACGPSRSRCARRRCPGPRRRRSDRRPVQSRDGGCAASSAEAPLRASRIWRPSSYVLVRAERAPLCGQPLPCGGSPTRGPPSLLLPRAIPADQIDLLDACRGDSPNVECGPVS